MIEINVETGRATWGEYIIDAGTRLDAFTAQYPQLRPSHRFAEPYGVVSTTYPLGRQMLEGELANGFVSFWNQRVVSMSLEPVDEINDDQEWWMRFQRWILAGHQRLLALFGQPHQTRSTGLFDEEEGYPPAFVDLIKNNWEYVFEWGRVGLAYESLDMSVGLYIAFTPVEHVTSWETLAEECDTCLNNEKQAKGPGVESLMLSHALIDLLKPHFDFESVQPGISYDGLFFRSRGINVRIHPNSFLRYYEIIPDDVTQPTLILPKRDGDKLIQVLRELLKPEAK